MEQPGLHRRHRDKNGEISRKHGNTYVGTLRPIYGAHFAEGCADTETLREVLQELDEPSLTHLVYDHERGQLERKIEAVQAR